MIDELDLVVLKRDLPRSGLLPATLAPPCWCTSKARATRSSSRRSPAIRLRSSPLMRPTCDRWRHARSSMHAR
jgi:hypothetical protein